MDLSIVIPAYNEERRVSKTINAYVKFFKNKMKDFEIIVVCDGNDRTDKVVRQLAKKHKCIRLLVFKNRLGKGGGVYAGFRASRGDIIGFTDADNSVEPRYFYSLIKSLRHYDCSIASRKIEGSKMIIPQSTLWVISMRIVSRVYSKLVNLILGLGIQDTQCGAKVLKKDVYTAIKHNLKVKGFEFDVELLWRIKRSGYTIHEIPVVWKHNLESKSSLKNIHKFFFLVLRLRAGLL